MPAFSKKKAAPAADRTSRPSKVNASLSPRGNGHPSNRLLSNRSQAKAHTPGPESLGADELPPREPLLPSSQNRPRSQSEQRLGAAAPAAGLFALGTGLVALVGWFFGIELFKSVLTGLAPMQPSTALCFVLTGTALYLLSTSREAADQDTSASAPAPRQRLATVLAFAPVAIGFLTLLGYFLHQEFWINRWVSLLAGGTGQVRMAPLAALNFVLLGGALTMTDWVTPRGYRPAQLLALGVAALCFEALLNYAYGSPFLYLGAYTRMAVPSAATLLVLALGVFFLNPRVGLAGEVTSPSLGGMVLRRMLLAAICLVPLLGSLRLLAEKAALVDSAHATSLLVLASLTTFSILVWRTAKALNETDRSRSVAEEALRLRNQELTDFFENASVGICWIGPDGIIHWANRAELELSGYGREEYVGRHISDFHLDVEESQDVLERWSRGEELRNYEMRLRSKDGSVRILSINSNPHYKDGRLVHTRCFNRDVTEKKAAEAALRKSEDEFRAMFELAAVGKAQINPVTRRFSMVNRRLCEITGFSPAELVGKDLFEIVAEEDRSKAASELDKLFCGEQTSSCLEQRCVRRDGSLIWVEISATIVRDSKGKPTRLFAVVQDITERRRAEEEVRRLNAELDQRVRTRTAQLEAINKELEAFCYSVSHDLRAPLRNIVGFSQALLQDYSERLDAEGKQYLDRACAAGQRMTRLIEDLLHLSRVGRSEMSRSEVDLSSMVQVVASELQKTEPNRQVQWNIAAGLKANGDPRLLRIAFENLLGNAWKFTGKTPRPVIEFGQEMQDEQSVFFVRDNGAGFDMTYADKLFGVFQRLHAATEFPGTGIGLATVQRIINRHGGRIWGQGETGKGATFYFTLPE